MVLKVGAINYRNKRVEPLRFNWSRAVFSVRSTRFFNRLITFPVRLNVAHKGDKGRINPNMRKLGVGKERTANE